jgi:hypothetical protein
LSSDKLNIFLQNNLRLTGIPPQLYDLLTQRLKFPNPKYLENARMGRWNRGVPKELRFYYRIRGGGLVIPRGFIRQLITTCRRRILPSTGNCAPSSSELSSICCAKSSAP